MDSFLRRKIETVKSRKKPFSLCCIPESGYCCPVYDCGADIIDAPVVTASVMDDRGSVFKENLTICPECLSLSVGSFWRSLP